MWQIDTETGTVILFWLSDDWVRVAIRTISPKSKNLALKRLMIVILILYPYDVKLMSMSLSFYVNFCQSSSIWFVQFFVSFLSVYIYIVYYLCLISPHGLAALAGDVKID